MRAAETFGRFGPGWLSRRTEVLSHRENGCQRYPELMESKGISLEFRYALDGIGLSESFRRKWIIRHVTWALEAEELAKEVVANPGEIPRWTRMAFWIRLYGVLWDLHEDWKADRARILALQSDETAGHDRRAKPSWSNWPRTRTFWTGCARRSPRTR